MGIAGHSEGAMIAPVVASRNKDVAFIILFAGPGITGKEILITQNEAILTAQGLSKDSTMKLVNLNKEIIEAVESNPKNENAQNLIKQVISKLNLSQPIEETYIKSYSVYLSPWFRTFFSFNPASYLSRVKCPVLVLNGSRDLQVLPKENLAAIEKALRDAKNTNYEIRALEGFNHLFQQSETGLPSEYGNTDKPAMDNKVLEITEAWIKKIPSL
ncbi:MAG: hypothetical protein HC905_24000 [Bacteroidales bacterium]|nr:hypothetical protein [Bacteroidales bacterium]